MWCFAAGTVAGSLSTIDWAQWWLIFPLLAMAAGLRSCRRWLPAALIGLAGLVHAQLAVEHALARRLPASLNDHVLTLAGRVASLPEEQVLAPAAGVRLWQTVFLFRLDAPATAWPVGRTLKLSHVDEAPPGFCPGGSLRLRVRVREARGPVNEAGFDAERFHLARGIDALGKVEAVLDREPCTASLLRFRDERSRGLTAAVPDGVAAAVLPALVAGDRRQLTAGLWEVFQRTGTAHLMAISGLHVSLVAGGVWWLFRWLLAAGLAGGGGRRDAASLSALPAFAAALGYAALAGFSLPTTRALVMTTVVLMASFGGRRAGVWRVIGLALVAVLLLDPLAPLEAGFWLSFLAVALLVLADRGVSVFSLQAALSLGTGAVAGWQFGSWSIQAILANLLLVPVFSCGVIPLALVGALLPGMDAALVLAGKLVEWSWRLLEILAAGPVLPAVPGWPEALALLAAAICWGLRSLAGPRWLALFLLLPWLWPAGTPPPRGGFDLVMFDAGQGQMSVVRTRHHVVVYDTGPTWREGSAVAAVLRPWLARRHLRPDLVFVSHGDDDHAGGVRDVLRLWPDVPVLSGEPGRVPAAPCLEGQGWVLDGVRIEVLWPAPVPLRRSNNRSCVLRVTGEGGSLLLTGDIEAPVEWHLAGTEVSAEVLQVAHHGSTTSSSYVFLRAVAPRMAVAGAGWLNRFGHPSPEVVRRFGELDIPFLNTADTGMQVIPFRAGQAPAATLWRQRSRAPWRFPVPVLE